MQEKEIKLGSAVFYPKVADGEINDGEVYAYSVELGGEDSPAIVEFVDKVKWSDIETIKSSIKEALQIDNEWPDTSDPEWDSHRVAKPDTHLWEVLCYVIDNPYCTSKDVENDLDLNGNTQNTLYDAKKRNIIKTVGKEGQKHLLAPTHLAYKELHIEKQSDGSKQEELELTQE